MRLKLQHVLAFQIGADEVLQDWLDLPPFVRTSRDNTKATVFGYCAQENDFAVDLHHVKVRQAKLVVRAQGLEVKQRRLRAISQKTIGVAR